MTARPRGSDSSDGTSTRLRNSFRRVGKSGRTSGVGERAPDRDVVGGRLGGPLLGLDAAGLEAVDRLRREQQMIDPQALIGPEGAALIVPPAVRRGSAARRPGRRRRARDGAVPAASPAPPDGSRSCRRAPGRRRRRAGRGRRCSRRRSRAVLHIPEALRRAPSGDRRTRACTRTGASSTAVPFGT